MGCDIHLIVQAERDGRWITIDAPSLDWHDESDRREGRWYGDRNYNAFAILAGVRNGTKFGDRLVPVVEPIRGMPKGVSHRDIAGAEHSFHWLTLQELVDFPWDRKRERPAESYGESAGRFYSRLIPALREWADRNAQPYEKVRIVMGFDS